MRYYFTGNIKDLRANGFAVHFAKEPRYTYANRNYESDYFNSLYIYLGNIYQYALYKGEITFNNPTKKGDDIRPYIQDLIEKGLVRAVE